MPNQHHGPRNRDTKVSGSVRTLFFLYLPPIGWTLSIPAPIGQLLQVALEHASVCLINATATGTEILKFLVHNIYPAPIGLLMQVTLEHASMCLINATATGTELLKSLILSDLCFFSASRLLLVG